MAADPRDSSAFEPAHPGLAHRFAYGRAAQGYGPAPDAFAALHPGVPEDEIDLRALLGTLWRGAWIVALSILVAGVLGTLLTVREEPVYRAAAKVMFDMPRANIEAGEAVVANTLQGAPLLNQIEVLRSAALMQRVVDVLDLAAHPAFNAALRPPETASWFERTLQRLRTPEGDIVPAEGPVLSSYLSRGGLSDLLIATGLRAPSRPATAPRALSESILPVPDPAVSDDFMRLNEAIVQRLQSEVTLAPVAGTFVIEISFVSPDPELAAEIVNAVAEHYIADQLANKREIFRSASAWLTARVGQLQARVEAAESAVLAAQARVSDRIGTSLSAVEQQIVARIAARDDARSRAAGLAAQQERLTAALRSGAEIGTLPEFRSAPTIAPLLARAAKLTSEDAQLAATLLPGHPARQRLASSMEGLRADTARQAQRLLDGIGQELALARERGAALDAEIATLQAQKLDLSTEAVEIRNLEREAQASRVIYESLLTRLQETNAQEDLQSADARILTPATRPHLPLDAAENRTLTMALAAGAVLGLSLVFLRERLVATPRSARELERLTGLPVLASVPRARLADGPAAALGVPPASSSTSDAGSVSETPDRRRHRGKAGAGRQAALAEAIRQLRTSLLCPAIDAPPRVVMFTSAVPGEGKSTTAALIALTARQMGKSAILVECDLRRPALIRGLGLRAEAPGLLALLDGTARLEDAVQVEPRTGLHVLATRPGALARHINAADVLSSDAFGHMIGDLARCHDLVVLDTPAALAVADARILAGLADAVAVCVRWDSTTREAVCAGVRALASVGAPIVGLVPTLVSARAAAPRPARAYVRPSAAGSGAPDGA